MKRNSFIAFLWVLRPINLAIIALMMYMLRYFIFDRWIDFRASTYLNDYMELQLSSLDFFLLVVSVVLIAAAGYIINDYFDLRADRINKPQRIIIGQLVKRRVAMATHFTFNCIGVLLGFYVAWKAGNWNLGFFNVFAATVLWFYSTNLKRQYLIGNLAIALLAGMIPLMVAKFDIPLLMNTYSADVQSVLDAMKGTQEFWEYTLLFPTSAAFFNYIYWWAIAYAGFAFVVTLAREIIKDLADLQGDKAVGCRTIPIVMGIPFTKGLVCVLIGMVLVVLVWLQRNFLVGDTTPVYFVLAIGAPLVAGAILTVRARERKPFLLASNLVKLAMLGAIIYTYFAIPGA